MKFLFWGVGLVGGGGGGVVWGVFIEWCLFFGGGCVGIGGGVVWEIGVLGIGGGKFGGGVLVIGDCRVLFFKLELCVWVLRVFLCGIDDVMLVL